jgi:hypothetical protein
MMYAFELSSMARYLCTNFYDDWYRILRNTKVFLRNTGVSNVGVTGGWGLRYTPLRCLTWYDIVTKVHKDM